MQTPQVCFNDFQKTIDFINASIKLPCYSVVDLLVRSAAYDGFDFFGWNDTETKWVKLTNEILDSKLPVFMVEPNRKKESDIFMENICDIDNRYPRQLDIAIFSILDSLQNALHYIKY